MTRLLWITDGGNLEFTGVGQYSISIIKQLIRRQLAEVDICSNKYSGRGFFRYFFQFFVFPFKVVFNRCNVIVLYQESLSFLIPFASLVGKQVIVFYHHAPRKVGEVTLLSTIKNLYLDTILNFTKNANYIVFPSMVSLNDYAEKYPNVQKVKLKVLPNLFDVVELPNNTFQPNELLKGFVEDSLAVNKIILLVVSASEPRKNLITVYKALSYLEPDRYSFIHVGKAVDGSYEAVLQGCASVVKLSFIRLLSLDKADLNYVYTNSNLLLMPSLHEGFGRASIEAQLAGCDVLASNIDIFRETLGQSANFVDQPLDDKAWASCIQNMQFKDRDVLNANAIKYVGDYSEDTLYDIFK